MFFLVADVCRITSISCRNCLGTMVGSGLRRDVWLRLTSGKPLTLFNGPSLISSSYSLASRPALSTELWNVLELLPTPYQLMVTFMAFFRGKVGCDRVILSPPICLLLGWNTSLDCWRLVLIILSSAIIQNVVLMLSSTLLLLTTSFSCVEVIGPQ